MDESTSDRGLAGPRGRGTPGRSRQRWRSASWARWSAWATRRHRPARSQ
jgi:hypothetical protein